MKKIFSLVALVFVLSSFSLKILDDVTNCTSWANSQVSAEITEFGPFGSQAEEDEAWAWYMNTCSNDSSAGMLDAVFISSK